MVRKNPEKLVNQFLILTFPRDYFRFPLTKASEGYWMRQRELSFPYKYASPCSAAGIQAASAEMAAEAGGTAWGNQISLSLKKK